MDYKELVEQLKSAAPLHETWLRERMLDAAEAIETLLKERDAAVKDLKIVESCKTCRNITPWCADNPDSCRGYKWRGPQKGGTQNG